VIRGGRHEADRGDFGRDLIITLVGIAVVAVVVFGGLWAVSAWRNGEDASSTTAAASSTSSGGVESSAAPAGGAATTTTVAAVSTTVASATTRATIGVRAPSEITVKVLNAVGTTGLAGRVTTTLRAAGYRMVEADDYEPLQDRSQVLFKDGYGPEAFELAAEFFPDAQVGMSPDIPADIDIIVLLGSSYEAE
jgi:hypothetical protein